MGIQHANSELVATAWLLSFADIPAGKVGTSLPQDKSTWADTGFIQLAVVGGASAVENSYRRPVISATCWATNRPSAQSQRQYTPWGKANDLAEAIVAACYEANGRSVTLAPAGAPRANVTQAWLLGEPRRLPVGDGSPVARYEVQFQLAWVELP